MCAPYRVVRTGPVCCKPRHRWVDASSVGLCWRWRRTFWTLAYTIAILKKQCQNGSAINLIIGDEFLFSFAVNVNEQRIIAFLTEKCFI